MKVNWRNDQAGLAFVVTDDRAGDGLSSKPIKVVIEATFPGERALVPAGCPVSPWSLPGVRSEKVGASANFPIASRTS
jgi:hypothetical protein